MAKDESGGEPLSEERLREELDRVRAEREELARRLDEVEKETQETVSRRRGRGRGRAVLATALIAIGVVLAPVAVVSTWAQRQLTDTAYFVDTFAPLASDPAVQDLVIGESVAAIGEVIDIDQIADDLFAGLAGLDLPPRAQQALVLLRGPAVSGVRSLIDRTVSEFVRSDAFATIWREALTVTHSQLVSTATGQDDAALTIGAGQQITLDLGPILDAVTARLVADGYGIAANLPSLSTSIVIAESSSVGLYLVLYQLVVALGIWVPYVALLLVVAGVLVARRRAAAIAWTAGALLVTMLLVGGGIALGENAFALAVADAIPRDAAIALYAGIFGLVGHIAAVTAVLAAAVLVIALFSGPWAWARRLRVQGGAAVVSLRESAERRGWTTGRAGEWLYRWRVPLRFAIGVVLAVLLILGRPLAPATIVWTALLGVVLVLLLEVIARPPGTPASDEDAVPAPSSR